MKLLTVGNPKTAKGESLGHRTGVLHLDPDEDICPAATPECLILCLKKSGRAEIFESIEIARKRKTVWFRTDRPGFMDQLAKDIRALVRNASRNGLKPAVRLNGTSDVDWCSTGIVEQFPEVQFYDYTKRADILQRYVLGLMPSNFHLTFSHSGENDETAQWARINGVNVAKVVSKRSYEALAMNNFIGNVDGDAHDLRFLDGQGGRYVYLKAKGSRARRVNSNSSFVHNILK